MESTPAMPGADRDEQVLAAMSRATTSGAGHEEGRRECVRRHRVLPARPPRAHRVLENRHAASRQGGERRSRPAPVSPRARRASEEEAQAVGEAASLRCAIRTSPP
jgi:hypothetical protein